MLANIFCIMDNIDKNTSYNMQCARRKIFHCLVSYMRLYFYRRYLNRAIFMANMALSMVCQRGAVKAL